MNVIRYEPRTVYPNPYTDESYSDCVPAKNGKYVKFSDYMRLVGALRKLRGQLAKKKRRNEKFRKEVE